MIGVIQLLSQHTVMLVLLVHLFESAHGDAGDVSAAPQSAHGDVGVSPESAQGAIAGLILDHLPFH